MAEQISFKKDEYEYLVNLVDAKLCEELDDSHEDYELVKRLRIKLGLKNAE